VTARPYLAACMTYANHGRYLREWVEFHRLVGFERFFLYDNGSTDESNEVLAPYVEAGFVEIHDWPGEGRQHQALTDCLARHRDDARWIAFFDVDEFLFNPRGHPVPELLTNYEEHPGLGVNLLLFGTSGHRMRPSGLVIESYLYRSGNPANRWVKSIVDPRRATRALGAHHFEYVSGHAVDVTGEPLEGWMSASVRLSRLRINHYYTKSQEDLVEKWELPRADTGEYRDPLDLDYFERIEQRFVRDETILRYLPALRAALGPG
jgi:Glycosyltransferase family 92